MTNLIPVSLSYEDSISSCWNDPVRVRKYKPYSLMSAIYSESPLMTQLVQIANLEKMLENMHGTCFCPSFSYGVRYNDYFASISPAQARHIVLSSCSPLLITSQDIQDCVRIPDCKGNYISIGHDAQRDVYKVNDDADIIKMEKKIVDMDNNVNGIVYILNGLLRS